MERIKLGTQAGNKLISNLKNCNLVVLVGSAISSWEPTCLFSGRQFTDEMFKFLFPSNFVDNNSKERNILAKFFKEVPFEHLLERYPNRDRLTSIFTQVFSVEKYNDFHKLLAEALIEGRIKALITTNYDLCLDKVFKQYNDSQLLRIISNKRIYQEDIIAKKIYFKIHGSTDNPSTLIFALTHESILQPWKRKILWKVLNQRVLVIIGYSGADFEICPEIERIPIKQIVWNTKEEDFPSNNAKILLNQKSGIQLIGDMKMLLTDLFEKGIISSFNPKTDRIDFVKSALDYNKIEIMEWRVSLLNSIGIPPLAQKASEELLSTVATTDSSMDYIRAVRQKAQALFHLGKYKESAFLFQKASLIAKRNNEKYLEADLLLDVSSALKSYGALFRSWHCNKIGGEIAMNIKNTEKKNRLLGKIFLRKVLLWRHFQLVTQRLKLNFLTQLINKKVKEYLRRAALLSLKAGNWFDFYQTRLLSERMKIPIDILSNDSNYYEPPPTKDAYTQLGYYIPLSIHIRQELKQNKGLLTSEEEKILYSYLEIAKIVKNFPEIWKITWLGIKRDKRWRKNKEIWRDFSCGFFSCQYTIGMRIFKLLFGE